jgi:hypothetical protein
MADAYRALEMLDRAIKASEQWGENYEKDPETHGGLINSEAKLQSVLTKYFRELSDRSVQLINPYYYNLKLSQIQASEEFTVDVIIEDSALDGEDTTLMNIMYDPVAAAAYYGAAAGETLYSRSIGVSKSSELVQRAAKTTVAQMVGKRVNKDGLIVDNPRPEYSISNTTRKNIRSSISTSLSLGESLDAASKRLQDVIKKGGAKRAELIAQTEAVNAYQTGQFAFATETGAIGKGWQSIGATDICGTFAKLGLVPIGYKYQLPSGRTILIPTAHGRCRCSVVWIYPEDSRSKKVQSPDE